jgi:hypothetical protein
MLQKSLQHTTPTFLADTSGSEAALAAGAACAKLLARRVPSVDGASLSPLNYLDSVNWQ